jgi:uridylate kinase
MKKIIVISLGGSLIIPKEVDTKFLNKFRKTLRKHYKTHKFIVVCGGGSTARKYISALKKEKKPKKSLSLAGIRATRTNALLVMQIFGKEANDTLPKDMKQVKSNLRKNNLVICGALRFDPQSTSDTTAAKLANYLNTKFINITNVKGLYTSNPKTNKNARFIPEISWEEFEKKARKTKFKAGQHFVLDQNAATLIKKHKIPTYIIDQILNNLTKILKERKFTGTIIQN